MRHCTVGVFQFRKAYYIPRHESTILLAQGVHVEEAIFQFSISWPSYCHVRLWVVSISQGGQWNKTNKTHRWKQAMDPRLAGLNTLTFSVWMSRGAGLALSIDGAIILLPMCKNLIRWIRPQIRWLPLDEAQWFHRQVAYSLLFWTIVHVSAHYVKYVAA